MKKEAKTFAHEQVSRPNPDAKRAKVFWFFFSKKNYLLPGFRVSVAADWYNSSHLGKKLMQSLSTAEQFDTRNPQFTADRFKLLAQMRSEAPVTFLPALQVYAVTRWQEVRDVLRDPVTFSSSGAFSAGLHISPEASEILPLTSPLFACNLINVDKPLHKRLRDPLIATFSLKRVQSLAPAMIADIEELLNSMATATGEIDLLRVFCRPLPLRVICRLLGFPQADAEKLSGWSDALVVFQIPGLPQEVQIGAAHGLRALEAYVRATIADKTATPDDGLISALIASRAAGDNDLSEDELVANISTVFFAGHETTISTLANAFHALLTSREQWAGIAAGEVDPDALTDELLRHDTPVMGLYRRTTVNSVIGGVEVPLGATLWVSYGAANRDPTKFDRPETLDFGRDDARHHVSFGIGAHNCIGQLLARLQLREGVTRLISRFPEMRLAPGATVSEIPHHALRAPIALPVLVS